MPRLDALDKGALRSPGPRSSKGRTEDLVASCVDYLATRALHVVGLFRTAAPLAEVIDLEKRYLHGDNDSLPVLRAALSSGIARAFSPRADRR